MRALSIGVDVHSIGSEKGGNETYYRELVKGLASSRTGHRFILYYTKDRAQKWLAQQGDFRSTRFNPTHPFLRIPVVAPWAARRDRLDIYHAQYILPPFL